MVVTLNVSVTPAKPDLEMTFWWYHDGAWEKQWGRQTDAAGKVTERFNLRTYPQTMRVTFDPGQVIDGVEYGGYTTPDFVVNDNLAYDISLLPEPVGPEEPVLKLIIAVASAALGAALIMLGYR